MFSKRQSIRAGAVAALLAFCTLPSDDVRALEINDASRPQLEQLNGLGVPTVAAILAERDKHGPFASWADLQRRVKGFQRKRLEQLDRQGLTVNGQPLPRTESKQ